MTPLERFRRDKDHYLGNDPTSPFFGQAFAGLAYYPASEAYVVSAVLEPAPARKTVQLGTSSGEEQLYFQRGSGAETYGAGRYLEATRLPDGWVSLDFNYAYHPFCAYSLRYRCPLPPTENHLLPPIYAGEKL